MSDELIVHPTIYRKDSKGNIRALYVERQGSSYRTITGLLHGKKVVSGWIHCKGKRDRTDHEQVIAEIYSVYRHHLTRNYFELPEETEQERFFKPMLAEKYKTFSPGFAQPKLDGIRCIANRCGLWSREGKPILGTPHINEALAPSFDLHPEMILDGELYNHDLKEDFNEIVSIVRKQDPSDEEKVTSKDVIEYHVYDLPSDSGLFSERYALLTQRLSNVHHVQIVPVVKVDREEDYDHAHDQWIADGYEGSMWRADDTYENKRSKHLRKHKSFQDDEFECLKIEEGVGHWAGHAKSVLCRLPDGRTFSAGVKGNRTFTKALLHETHHVVTVQYFHFTPDGIPRFPVVIKFWGDKRTL